MYNRQIAFRMRVEKAKSALSFVGRVNAPATKGALFCCPGSDGRQYFVRVDKVNDGQYTVKCWRKDSGEFCKGNSYHKTICYHSMMAFEKLAAESNFSCRWVFDPAHVQHTKNLTGGLYCTVHSAHNFDAMAHCVVFKKEK